jgi:Domain of Unknown Function (DUF1080)
LIGFWEEFGLLEPRLLLSLFLGLSIFGVPAYAADKDFNGRWDITPTNDPRNRAWWLEIEGAGTPNAKGKFISAYNGDLNVIDTLKIENGNLEFGFTKSKNLYKARLEGSKLIGNSPQSWVGVRAPEIKDKDDASWKKGKPVDLFIGQEIKEKGWSGENGILKSTGGAANVGTTEKFWNFELHVEYRVSPHSNSGVGLRARYEVQILEDFGKPAGTHSNGALYSRIAPRVNASKPADEWQTFDIRLVGRTVTVVLNGQTVIDKGHIDGLTAMATDPNEGEPGPITLQGDHGPVEFRKITLTPLTRK